MTADFATLPVSPPRPCWLQRVPGQRRSARRGRVFEMRLKRIADTDWPAAGAIAPK